MSSRLSFGLAFLLCLGARSPARAADCNRNGVDDSMDIALGTSLDCDADGVPDECELTEQLDWEPIDLSDAGRTMAAGRRAVQVSSPSLRGDRVLFDAFRPLRARHCVSLAVPQKMSPFWRRRSRH